MGLTMGVVDRKAQFALYLTASSSFDIVIEIKNDAEDYCCHRITNRSPKYHRPITKNVLKVPTFYLLLLTL